MQRAASKSVLLGISHLCDEIQRSEVLDLSTQFQQLFHEFNLQYFAGRLPNYKVRVVYDIAEWAGPDGDFGALATHQPELRRIFIRVTDRLPPMATVLLAEMACLISDCNPDRYREETRRLRKAGAPIECLKD